MVFFTTLSISKDGKTMAHDGKEVLSTMRLIM
jgi:hypothetical protein